MRTRGERVGRGRAGYASTDPPKGAAEAAVGRVEERSRRDWCDEGREKGGVLAKGSKNREDC